MYTYRVSVRWSNDGKSWTSTTKIVKAESDSSAMYLVQSQYSRYAYVEITNCVRSN